MSEQEVEFHVPCGNHPDERATHNCMNCGKPLCMTCVKERGYYCSDECKAAVQESEPSAARDEKLEQMDAQVERSLATTGSILKKLKWPVILVIVAVAGFYTYKTFFGPKGRVIVSITVPSEVEMFKARIVGRDAVLVQANDELSRVKLSTQQKTWSVNLTQYEKQVTEDGMTSRHRPHFTGVQGDDAVVTTPDQMLHFDIETGVLRTKTTATPSVHGESTIWREQVVLIEHERPARTEEDEEEAEEITAGDPDAFSAKRLLGLAKGESPAPAAMNYTVRFTAAADGKELGRTKVSFTGYPQSHVLGENLALAGGRNLAIFADGYEPLWQAQLDADIAHVTRGGNVIAVATEKSVVAFDAKTGQQRWARSGLDAGRVAVGPDGAVYAQIQMPASDVKDGEGKKYRPAKVALTGMSNPMANVPVLLKLDAQDGHTLWGVRNIGEHVLFDGDKLFVCDATEQMDLLAAAGPFQGYYSVRQLNPRTGADIWSFIAKGLLFEQSIVDGKPFLVAAEDPPMGRRNPACTYLLQVVDGK